MKKVLIISLLFSLLLCGTVCAADKAEWTVMISLCGTDLETDGGQATLNLKEISETVPNESVNVVIQTGGTKKWQTKNKLGFEISNEKLQRWNFDANGFTLIDELPLAPMNAPDTIADFIRWASEAYPAEKFALVIWDHGGGSRFGNIVDQLFPDSPSLSLQRFGEALDAAGTHFEAVLLDICMGGSLDSALALAPYSNYMIASEELVAGEGTNYQDWLNYLYEHPDANGARFGRTVCNSMQEKYAELTNEMAASSMTFSVIDLSKVEAVAEAYGQFLTELSALLKEPGDYNSFSYFTQKAEMYGYTPGYGMIDLVDLAQKSKGIISQSVINKVRDATEDAVLYLVKGDNRSYSHGLSIYFCPSDLPAGIEQYAVSCQIPAYLAYMDAIRPDWDAPEWVYQSVDRVPEIDPEKYNIEYQTEISPDRKHLNLHITNGINAVNSVDYELLLLDTGNNLWLDLGSSGEVEGNFTTGEFTDRFDGFWPEIDGTLCQMNLSEEGTSMDLYNIPVRVNGQKEISYLRASFSHNREELEELEESSETGFYAALKKSSLKKTYNLLGLWPGFDASTSVPKRGVTSMKELAGSQIVLNYGDVDLETYNSDGWVSAADSITVGPDTVLKEGVLPEGIYVFYYKVKNVFGRTNCSYETYLIWDGVTPQFYTDAEYFELFPPVEESHSFFGK